MSRNLIDDLYSMDETELVELGIEVPSWISQDIDSYQLAAILHGGCASGAYMPAVTYYDARETMMQYEDEILDYADCSSFDQFNATYLSGLICDILSFAVELWASNVADEVVAALKDRNEVEA
jgi:hypothetical protein